MNETTRTCVGCFKKGPKDSFIRIVRTPDKKIRIASDKQNKGRGVYLCHKNSCITRAIHRKGKDALSYNLKMRVNPKIEKELVKLIQ